MPRCVPDSAVVDLFLISNWVWANKMSAVAQQDLLTHCQVHYPSLPHWKLHQTTWRVSVASALSWWSAPQKHLVATGKHHLSSLTIACTFPLSFRLDRINKQTNHRIQNQTANRPWMCAQDLWRLWSIDMASVEFLFSSSCYNLGVNWCRFCCECVMSSLGTGSQGVCSVCASPMAASQLVTPPPKQKLAALIPLMDPASVTSPTRSANSSEDAGDPAQGVHINSKLKTLLADLTKVREEHDGAKVSTTVFPLQSFIQTANNSDKLDAAIVYSDHDLIWKIGVVDVVHE